MMNGILQHCKINYVSNKHSIPFILSFNWFHLVIPILNPFKVLYIQNTTNSIWVLVKGLLMDMEINKYTSLLTQTKCKHGQNKTRIIINCNKTQNFAQVPTPKKQIAFKYKKAKYESHNYFVDPTTHFQGDPISVNLFFLLITKMKELFTTLFYK